MFTAKSTPDGSVEELLSKIRELYAEYRDNFRFESILRNISIERQQTLDVRRILTLVLHSVWNLPVRTGDHGKRSGEEQQVWYNASQY